jgi:hypothetical protein
MGLARELERRLERLVDGATAAVFRGRMHPVDMAEHLVRQVDFMQEDGLAGPGIPNSLVFRVNPADIDDAIDCSRLAGELAGAVEATAAERGWKLNGPVTVAVTPDPSVPRGLCDCEGETRRGPLSPWARLVASDPARSLEVRDNRNVLGRAVDCDIVLSVPEVSRHHALIVRRAGQVLLSDLGSANGSAVNGVLVGKEPEVIVAGDRLRFGETELSLRPV